MRFSLSKVFFTMTAKSKATHTFLITKFEFNLFNFFVKFFFVLKKGNRINNFLYLVGIICFLWWYVFKRQVSSFTTYATSARMCFNHVVSSLQFNLHLKKGQVY